MRRHRRYPNAARHFKALAIHEGIILHIRHNNLTGFGPRPQSETTGVEWQWKAFDRDLVGRKSQDLIEDLASILAPLEASGCVYVDPRDGHTDLPVWFSGAVADAREGLFDVGPERNMIYFAAHLPTCHVMVQEHPHTGATLQAFRHINSLILPISTVNIASSKAETEASPSF